MLIPTWWVVGLAEVFMFTKVIPSIFQLRVTDLLGTLAVYTFGIGTAVVFIALTIGLVIISWLWLTEEKK